MAVTQNLGITRLVSEGDSGKIQTINAFTDEFDATLAGMLSLSVAGNVNVTLTRIQCLNRVFKFTGALTGNIVVFIQATGGTAREFTVWNATSGAFTLTIKTTAGGSTGITVTQGEKRMLFHDGTNVYDSGTDAGVASGASTTLNNLSGPTAINTHLIPGSAGLTVGDATNPWGDLHLKEGGTINWDNGDVLITQTGNVLKISGASSGVEINPDAAGGLYVGATVAETLDSGAISDQLHLRADAKALALVLDVYGSTTNLIARRAGGTKASPTATAADASILTIAARGYETTTPGFTGSRAMIQFMASEAFTNTAHGTRITFHTTPIGGTTTLERLRITDSGNLKIGGTASRATTQGTPHLDLFNGTDPAGTLTNGVSLYSSGGEFYAMNAAGVAYQLTGGASDVVRLTINAVPTFDLNAGALSVAQIVPFSSNVTVATGKTFDHIRLSKIDGNPNVFILQGTGNATGLSVQAKIDSTSASGSYFYGVETNLLNAGPGTVRGVYSRVTSDTGSTGDIYGGAFAITPNSTSGTAYILQLAGNTFTDGVMWITSDLGPGNAEIFNDGIIFHPDISIASGGAFLKGYQTVGQDGDFLSYLSQASAVLFKVEKGGKVGIGVAPDASSALRIDSTTGALLPPRMTTTQRDALTAIDGHIIYNSTTGDLNYRKAGAWVAPGGGGGSGDVVGPASATDNAIVRFDSTTGKLVQNSVVTIANTNGIIAGTQGITISGSTSGTVAVSAPAVAGTTTFTLPGSNGSSGQYLQTDGSGITSWQTVSGGGVALGDTPTWTGAHTWSKNSAASTPTGILIGTWFTGGSATTTKPHFLIEPTGTTSTGWSTGGTGLGVNAASGFVGNQIDLQVAGVSYFRVGYTEETVINTRNTYINGAFKFDNGGASFRVANPIAFGQSVNDWDATISRNAAGIIQIGTTSANAAGSLALTSGILQPLTVATLPTAVSGRFAYITDGDSGLAWGATAVNSGAGATKYFVWYNGTNWTVAGK